MSNTAKSLLTEKQLQSISELPLVSAKVLLTLLGALYAEPGFSDVEVNDLAKEAKMPMETVKGAIGYLTKIELVWTYEMDSADISKNRRRIIRNVREFIYSQLHSDSAPIEDGDARKEEAKALLVARIAQLEAAPVSKPKAVAKKAAPVVTPARPAKGSAEAKALMAKVRASMKKEN